LGSARVKAVSKYVGEINPWFVMSLESVVMPNNRFNYNYILNANIQHPERYWFRETPFEKRCSTENLFNQSLFSKRGVICPCVM